MRIIAGIKKNHKILTPKGMTTRPALAQVREAIFSSLGNIEGKIFMDVFAGCGSLGLEALSREASACYFVENNPKAVSCIINNLESLGFEKKAHIFKRTMPHGLKNIKIDRVPDVIFCDPPYDQDLINRTIGGLLKYNFIDPKTLLIIEHTRRENPECEDLELFKQKKFGQTLISYLKLRSDPTPQ
ncbi:16S rRNA (guanine(966)-N(2))-methyltransferase RsmD [bacterium]|nr:16S rRNA (guanine(966)-N(2))-methyltransferase RsmD [bacterium]MBU1916918.1 16S rRNA (guanine(966)-N(2))-methyltransferase RsmD [bacterium]